MGSAGVDSGGQPALLVQPKGHRLDASKAAAGHRVGTWGAARPVVLAQLPPKVRRADCLQHIGIGTVSGGGLPSRAGVCRTQRSGWTAGATRPATGYLRKAAKLAL